MVRTLPIPSQFKDALHALREDRDNIRTLLRRRRGSQGPKWAINQFDVLQDLLDSETRGKEGREFNLAEEKVKNIIKNHVFKYIQTKYMLDKSNQVVEIDHSVEIDRSQQTYILPRPTNQSNNAAMIPLPAHGLLLLQQQQQQPLPLFLPSWNPNPFMMAPGGMIPIVLRAAKSNLSSVGTQTSPNRVRDLSALDKNTSNDSFIDDLAPTTIAVANQINDEVEGDSKVGKTVIEGDSKIVTGGSKQDENENPQLRRSTRIRE